jgi:hypothetical protein
MRIGPLEGTEVDGYLKLNELDEEVGSLILTCGELFMG